MMHNGIVRLGSEWTTQDSTDGMTAQMTRDSSKDMHTDASQQ